MEDEIDLIKNEELKKFAKYCMERVPEYFFKVAASSTGKYHPAYTLGEGGLVRHVKAAVKIAESLLELEQNKHLNHDTIIFALIFHDCLKHGKEDSGHTEFLHPELADDFIWNLYLDYPECKKLSEIQIEDICDCIATHMGEWNTNKYSIEELLKPTTYEEKFVHMCDFLASRKFITVEVGE